MIRNAADAKNTETAPKASEGARESRTREELRDAVRTRYGAAAREAARGGRASCGPSSTESCRGPDTTDRDDPITSNLYDEEESVPESALTASLGCGNPTALADLHEGEVVLDLGSGGGIDVLLSARRVGPSGKAYGVDMTEEMLELARRNAREARAENVEFRKGEIENLPLDEGSVDVIISNCVINLSTDKSRVLREAYRVLRPGGRFAVSDVVVRGSVPADIRQSMEAWIGCVAGALEEEEYGRLLREAGFVDVEIEPTRVYDIEDARDFLREAGIDPEAAEEEIGDRFMAAFVRARKPELEPAS